ncbi:hypothetical protein [Jatrophihabitans sp.]|uniref:hypothetical protein n=1 Tax=Jatrophihabitans sp. TaxID=1932789 RepID=UPI003916E887
MTYVVQVEPGNQQYPADSSERWPREVGPRGWEPPAMPPAQAGRAFSLSRARTGLIVLAVVLTELVVIAAADNQWVSNKIVRSELRTNSLTLRSLANSWLTYTWRLSPRDGANANQVWASQIALVVVVLVLSGVLVAAVVRGPVTFGRAFFGTWMAVVVATLVGAFVRGLIEPFGKLQLANSNRVTRAAFGSFGVNQAAVAAGFGLGLLVAVVAATVAVASRRGPAQAADSADSGAAQASGAPPYQQPEQPPPYYGDEESATTQLPALPPDQPAPRPAPGRDDATARPAPRRDDGTARYQPIDVADDDGEHGAEEH